MTSKDKSGKALEASATGRAERIPALEALDMTRPLSDSARAKACVEKAKALADDRLRAFRTSVNSRRRALCAPDVREIVRGELSRILDAVAECLDAKARSRKSWGWDPSADPDDAAVSEARTGGAADALEDVRDALREVAEKLRGSAG